MDEMPHSCRCHGHGHPFGKGFYPFLYLFHLAFQRRNVWKTIRLVLIAFYNGKVKQSGFYKNS
jgi:hypothetical protein